MKNGFASFIMTIVMILIIVVLGLFGVLIYQDIMGEDSSQIVENFVSTYNPVTDNSVQDSKKITTPQVVKDKINQIINSSSETKEDTNYSNVQINKYFYNQLNDYSKTIYKALESNKDNLKTGTARIDLGTSFTSILEKENGENLLGQYYQSAVETYLYDNPDVFYISANKLYLNIETITKRKTKTYNVFINNGDKPNYFTDDFNSQSEVEEAINKVEQIKNQIVTQKTNNVYSDVKLVHDYLINNVDYDTTVSQNNIYDIYGALVKNKCVCEGYAKAFKYLLDNMNIPCVMVIGKATNSNGTTENHAWNYVQINQNWYAVDCTWDDPVIIGNGKVGNETKYKYFLRGSSYINRDHISNGQFTDGGETYQYPTLSVTDYR